MIISIASIDGEAVAQVHHFDSYSEEREAFISMSDTLAETHTMAQAKREIHSYFHKTTEHAELRTHGIDPDADTEIDMIVALVPDNGLLNKKWVYEDKEVQNSQGGTTHLTGWHLV